ncbi:hypothetical protein G3U99_10865 [Vibrio coralliilyticus OCN008]|uniref:hypothetical protein n=1 Tax=Vibrio coralliilyticus TaxID=190893 RepID=UPI0011476184|nr:hypothetical protein [Vibrio coralliilyticus]QIJ84718.1 hypothetical protein G3U99_10865 [Vibrio coralliilyticus OCN008]
MDNQHWLLYIKSSSTLRKKVLSKLDVAMKEKLLNELNDVPEIPLSLLRKTLKQQRVTEIPQRILHTPERQKIEHVLNYLVKSDSFDVSTLTEAYVMHSGLSIAMKTALSNYASKRR